MHRLGANDALLGDDYFGRELYPNVNFCTGLITGRWDFRSGCLVCCPRWCGYWAGSHFAAR